MGADPLDSELEAERAYWRTRLANLELLLCELLIKNERLRQQDHKCTSVRSDQGPVLTDS